MIKTNLRATACLAFALIAVVQLNAQKSKGTFSAKFEDGTVIDYDLIQNHPDELFKKQITAMGTASEIGQSSEVSFSGIVPGRFQYKAGLQYSLLHGFGGINVGGMWFFRATEKPIQQSCSVKTISTGSTTTKYVVKVDATKGKYLGVHGEFGYTNIGYGKQGGSSYSFNGGEYNLEKVSFGVVAVGLGYASMKGVQVKVKENQGGYIGGTRVFTAAADLAFYPAMSVTSSPLDSTATSHTLEAGDISSGSVGFRVFAQAHTTFLYHKKKGAPNGFMGLTWKLGIAKAPYVNSALFSIAEGKMAPLVGLGLFYTFY